MTSTKKLYLIVEYTIIIDWPELISSCLASISYFLLCWGIDSRIQAVRGRWQIPNGASDAEASSSQMAWDREDPCTSILIWNLAHRWGIQSQTGRYCVDRGWGNPSKLKWRVYPTTPSVGDREDLKRGNLEGHQWTTNFQIPSSLKEFTFTFSFPSKTFHFLFPQ
jgi:hypothetical protein